jgi:NTE family protein
MASIEPFQRTPDDQQAFDAAKSKLAQADVYIDPNTGDRLQNADLVLEGGGVKGIGLVGAVVVLSEAGYAFPRVAGTSAGAIAATLIAAVQKSGQSLDQLKDTVASVDYSQFEHKGLLRKLSGNIGAGAHLLVEMGLYNGDYLAEWLQPVLDELGITKFGQLKLTAAELQGASIPSGEEYRLVVHASDITRRTLLRMAWDYPIYGLPPDDQSLVTAVRASMSIPFFFEPVRLKTFESSSAVYGDWPGGAVTLVDGGMLSNFPIDCFARVDTAPARWPTFGVKLSAKQIQMSKDRPCDNTLGEAIDCLQTMMNEWDRYYLDADTASRTIFVDCGSITATDFNLTTADQQQLFDSGCQAATQFLIKRAASLPPSAA